MAAFHAAAATGVLRVGVKALHRWRMEGGSRERMGQKRNGAGVDGLRGDRRGQLVKSRDRIAKGERAGRSEQDEDR